MHQLVQCTPIFTHIQKIWPKNIKMWVNETEPLTSTLPPSLAVNSPLTSSPTPSLSSPPPPPLTQPPPPPHHCGLHLHCLRQCHTNVATFTFVAATTTTTKTPPPWIASAFLWISIGWPWVVKHLHLGPRLGCLQVCSILFTPLRNLSFAAPFLHGVIGVCHSKWLKVERDRMALFCPIATGCGFVVRHSSCCSGERKPWWHRPLLERTIAPPLKMVKIAEGESRGWLP